MENINEFIMKRRNTNTFVNLGDVLNTIDYFRDHLEYSGDMKEYFNKLHNSIVMLEHFTKNGVYLNEKSN